MSTFVLVHGGWGGGWEWSPVAADLRGRGHTAIPITLAGLGDRANTRTTDVDLSTHIDDVVQVLWFEDLHDAILVGWSYGGAVVDGAADVSPDRLAAAVNLDGEVAVEGRTLVEGWTDEGVEAMRAWMEEGRRSGWVPPPSEDDLAQDLSDPHLGLLYAPDVVADALHAVAS